MALSRHPNELSAQDEIQNRIEHIRRKFDDLGIKVRDVRYTRYAQPRYMDVSYSNKAWYDRAITDEDIRYDAHWELSVDQRQAEELCQLTSFVNSLQHDVHRLRDELSSTMLQLAGHNAKITELKQVLHENPGIRDQWNELMVLMKMAGFDANLA